MFFREEQSACFIEVKTGMLNILWGFYCSPKQEYNKFDEKNIGPALITKN